MSKERKKGFFKFKPHQNSPNINITINLTFLYNKQSYSASQVSAAVSQGCKYLKANQQVGSNNYPHRYNNYEGFDFRVAAPWQEFPISRSGVYTGGEFCLTDPKDVHGLRMVY